MAVGFKTSWEEKAESIRDEYARLDRLPFDSERKFSATLTEKELFIVGAPELVLDRSRMTQKERILGRKRLLLRRRKGIG